MALAVAGAMAGDAGAVVTIRFNASSTAQAEVAIVAGVILIRMVPTVREE